MNLNTYIDLMFGGDCSAAARAMKKPTRSINRYKNGGNASGPIASQIAAYCKANPPPRNKGRGPTVEDLVNVSG